ncbi:Cytochrome c553 [Hydrocarboniphaga daqingensis]|uniref:Cytochrome c553 n=1 Tax=Hydrocarboniphaga daqingensis TaxID=490188 RepID=A0A1M5LIB0_9GAMM|nr:c-type cytochrome [Hydrocarboniphaga daqingensis]SHG64103.1 Cytochrome c553 [Hydrocarboniphaga daqingensis]
MKRLFLAVMFAAPAMVSFAASAQTAAPAKDPFTQGDAAAGATKAAVCAACHGAGGNSAMPEWPNLAGQGSTYIVSQLKAFKSGARKNAIMMGQAAALSDADMADIAAYLTAQKVRPGLASKDAVAVAEPLYRGGDASRGLPACSGCHGPRGAGNPAAGYPRIGAQHATYTATQLTAYKSGERGATGTGQMMQAVAAKLTDAEIQALASYVNGLQ